MKRMVCSMMWILLLVAMGWPQTLTVGNGIASPGQTISISGTLSPGSQGIYTTQFDLAIPSGLALLAVTRGPDLPATFTVLSNLSNLRTILLDNSGGTIPLPAGIMVRFSIQVTNGVGLYSMSLTNVVASNSSGSGAIPVLIAVGKLNVGVPPDPPMGVAIK